MENFIPAFFSNIFKLQFICFVIISSVRQNLPGGSKKWPLVI